MKKVEQELIIYLSKHTEPIRSQEIATALNISVRSVKNYVRNINSLYSKNIILSSRNGYELSSQSNGLLVLSGSQEKIPQSLEERSFYIIKQLVLRHNAKIEIFELCDNLCISYSTVKSIISKMNKTFSSYNVEFICENDCVKIIGDEINKRKLLSYVLNEESNNSFMDTKILEENFANLDVKKLQTIIKSTFKDNNYYLNDFSSMNLLLHLLIIIDREINGNPLKKGKTDFEIKDEKELGFLNDFINRLESNFDIVINEFEWFEIYMLFKANANFNVEESKESLKEIVGTDLVDLTNEYVNMINTHYLVDLSNPTFTTPFSLHLKNLLLRAETGRYTKNPMLDVIRSNSPLIYDMSIFISLDLMQRFHIEINEDETAFLAMHIGSEIERQAHNKEKIPVAVLCPDYRDLSTQIMNNLMLNFGNQLYMAGRVNHEEDIYTLNNGYVTILFTTIPVHYVNENTIVVRISPINLNAQYDLIQNAIMTAQEKYRDEKLKLKFNDYFNPDLFTIDSKLKTKDQVLTNLCDKLLIQNYVDESFEEDVYKRENAATTAFGNIAIPHSVEMNAIKTSIAVAISKEGFQWNSNTVHVVFLLAINKADRRTFRALYESLISLCSENKTIQEIRKCTNFNEFKSIIYSSLDEV